MHKANPLSSSRSIVHSISPTSRLLILVAFLLFAISLFLLWDIKASWSFTLNFRGKKLLTLIIVGISIAVATLLFQTICNNQILTPGIMGFDSLFILIQAVLVLTLGVIGFSTLNPYIKWVTETTLMIGCMWLLAKFLFRGSSSSLHYLMLAGIVLGIFFSSLSSFIFRLLDPTAFSILQDSLFATFGSVNAGLLRISLTVLVFTLFVLWKIHNELDVMLLGQNTAVNLGVDSSLNTLLILMLVAVLVSLSTALVGPVTFFGLLVVHMTYRLAGTYQHRFLIPFSALLGMLTLIVGEFLLQHVFQFKTRLSIIIEFIGGLFFLALIIRQGKA